MSRILIDARMIGPRTTGIGLYISHLVRHLPQIDSENEYLFCMLPDEARH
ncbi:MAG: hypothetical protein HY460_00670, partial [Parcubacteria group bacterium]|nr:hypothetical protein [Parcubacteria group bacterium]